MQYVVVNIDLSNSETLDSYIETNHCEHMRDMRQTNVCIMGIQESYNANTTRILTDKGYLFILIDSSDTTETYHLYELFKEPSSLEFKHVLIINEPVDFKSPIYENTHRIVLKRAQSSGRYYAQPTYLGVENGKYVYSFDMDGFRINATDYYPDDDGFYRLTNKISNDGLLYMLISYKQYMYFNVSPTTESLRMVFKELDGTQSDIGLYKYDYSNFYVDDSTDDDDAGLNLGSQRFLCFSVEAVGDDIDVSLLPEQIMLEVY